MNDPNPIVLMLADSSLPWSHRLALLQDLRNNQNQQTEPHLVDPAMLRRISGSMESFNRLNGSGTVRRGTYGNVQVYLWREGLDVTPPLTWHHPGIQSPADRLPTDLVASVPQILFANLAVASALRNTLWLHLCGALHYVEISFDIVLIGLIWPPRAAEAILMATRITVHWVTWPLSLGMVALTIGYTHLWHHLILFVLVPLMGELELMILAEGQHDDRAHISLSFLSVASSPRGPIDHLGRCWINSALGCGSRRTPFNW